MYPENMGRGPITGHARDEIRGNLLCHPCNKNMIFFRHTDSGDVEILRILHESMGSGQPSLHSKYTHNH